MAGESEAEGKKAGEGEAEGEVREWKEGEEWDWGRRRKINIHFCRRWGLNLQQHIV